MNSSLCHLMFGEQNWRALEELRVGGNPQLHVYLDAMPLLAQLRLLDLSGAVDVPAALFTQWANQQTTKWRHLDLHGARITNLPSNGTADNDANSEQRWREIGVQMGQVQQICSSDLQWLDVSQLHLLGELSVRSGRWEINNNNIWKAKWPPTQFHPVCLANAMN